MPWSLPLLFGTSAPPPPRDISVVSPPFNHLGTDAEATVIHHHCTYTAHTYSAYTCTYIPRI